MRNTTRRYVLYYYTYVRTPVENPPESRQMRTSAECLTWQECGHEGSVEPHKPLRTRKRSSRLLFSFSRPPNPNEVRTDITNDGGTCRPLEGATVSVGILPFTFNTKRKGANDHRKLLWRTDDLLRLTRRNIPEPAHN